MIRVVIVEDSPTARQLLVHVLGSDPEIQVVGEARDGVEGVALTQKLRPDVVTMDIQMPNMDGLAATREIMITAPTPVVIATSSLLASEVDLAMRTLQAGALAVLRKPGGRGPAFEEEARKLIATVKAMSQVKVVRHWRAAADPPRPEPAPDPGRKTLVAVATSTGGPAALQRLLSGLPPDFAAPLLVVQHITHGFTQGLAAWLTSATGLRVKIAEQGEVLAPATAYLAPDDRHLGVSARGTATISAGPPVRGFRPSGTFLFESVGRSVGAAAVAVIMTGMGDDGVAGLAAVRQAGGRIIAQDESSCVVFGMPAAAIAAGLPDAVLPLDGIAPRLVQLVGRQTTA